MPCDPADALDCAEAEDAEWQHVELRLPCEVLAEVLQIAEVLPRQFDVLPLPELADVVSGAGAILIIDFSMNCENGIFLFAQLR